MLLFLTNMFRSLIRISYNKIKINVQLIVKHVYKTTCIVYTMLH